MLLVLGALGVLGAAHVVGVTLMGWWWWVTMCFLYTFLFYALDDSDVTGTRSWHALRCASYWARRDNTTAVTYQWVDRAAISTCRTPVVYVVHGNRSNVALIRGFGLHGGAIDTKRVAYLLPAPMLAIPLLRECLMYTGAVAARLHTKDRMGVVLGLLRRNRSVAFAPRGMTIGDDENADGVRADLVNFSAEHNVKLVPVLVTGEAQRYAFLRTHDDLQRWMRAWCGWPFPFAMWLRADAKPLRVCIGRPVDPGDAADFARQVRAFREVYE